MTGIVTSVSGQLCGSSLAAVNVPRAQTRGTATTMIRPIGHAQGTVGRRAA
jgi:hypothetical protein